MASVLCISSSRVFMTLGRSIVLWNFEIIVYASVFLYIDNESVECIL